MNTSKFTAVEKFRNGLLFWSILAVAKVTQGYMVDGNPNKRADFLDPKENYHLQWMVDWERNKITFNVTVKTEGWILFGLANNDGDETGKDVVIGGVMGRNGQAYFTDRHEEGGGGQVAILDEKQDYKLEAFWERRGETFLSFSRDLDTCDEEDYPISDNKVTLIWAYGDSDNLSKWKNTRQRGSYEMYLLEPEYTPRIVRDSVGNPSSVRENIANEPLRLWTMIVKEKMPSAHTSYLCTIHKAPRLGRKHHVVGFDIFLPDAQSLQHVHHFTYYRCRVPPGYNARNIFESFVDAPGESCLFRSRPPTNSRGMPFYLCDHVFTPWAIGGRAYFLPPEAGIPIGEELDEYYMVQAHYDNPQQLTDVDVTIRMDLWYTSQLRPNDAGHMAAGVEIPGLPPTILVPPQSTDHRAFGHCSSECTRRMFPQEGITVFSALMHSHNSGVRVRTRHFDMDNRQELPWIFYDDNYSNQFQQVRQLRENVKLFPGDQLTVECSFDNTWTNRSVVAGLSTAQEMCSIFMFYYGSIQDYSQCRSQFVDDEGRRRFLGGLENMTFSEERTDWVATSPRRLKGLTVTEVADSLTWNEDERAELQEYHEVTQSVGMCSRDLFMRSRESLRQTLETRRQVASAYPPTQIDTEDDFYGDVGYPFDAKPYVPEERNGKCLAAGTG